MLDQLMDSNGIRLHYLDTADASKPALVMMHGLTANAHAFDGLLARGLATHFRVIAVDLRGRGGSSKPEDAYRFEDHALDIIGLLDALELSETILCGHSYGGYLGVYLAARYPQRVKKLAILDAAISMNARLPEMLLPALSRLDKTFVSWDAYLEHMKAAPHNTFWEPEMEDYYRADITTHEDGTVTPIPSLAHIISISRGTAAEAWPELFAAVQQPALLLNATGAYALEQALLPEQNARDTAQAMPHCRYILVPGNHQTMLYGPGAQVIVEALQEFSR